VKTWTVPGERLVIFLPNSPRVVNFATCRLFSSPCR
jgi:hypothetical protein